MLLLSLKDTITSFAENNGLDKWDWIALSITSSTLIISFIALIVACKTLKSQKETARNTAPDINKKIQGELLLLYVSTLFASYIEISALYYALIKTKFELRPSHKFWQCFKNPNDYLYQRIFYNDSDKFAHFKDIIDQAKGINNEIETLRLLLDNNESIDEIKNEFLSINMEIDFILGPIFYFLKDVFCISKSNLLDLLIINLDVRLFTDAKVRKLLDNTEFDLQGFTNYIIENYSPKTQQEENVYLNLDDYLDHFTNSIANFFLKLIDDDIKFKSDELYAEQRKSLKKVFKFCIVHAILKRYSTVLYKGLPFSDFLNPNKKERKNYSSELFPHIYDYVLYERSNKDHNETS